MNIRKKISDALVADQDLVDLVGGEIHFYLLPDNFRSSKALLFNVSISEAVKDLEGRPISKTYSVNFTIISKKTEYLNDIALAVEAIMLDMGAGDQSEDEPAYDSELDVYVLEKNFELKL